MGSCDWSAIRAIRQAVSIPVIANGGIATSDDAARCLEETGVDAVMSCEAVLENPGLFASEELKKSAPRPFDTVLMYLDLAEKYHSCQPKAARAHIFKFLFGAMESHRDFFQKFGEARFFFLHWLVEWKN